MDLRQLKGNGPNLTAAQQNAFFFARKRRRERENANLSEFKVRGDVVGISMNALLHAVLTSVGDGVGMAMAVTLQAA